MYFPASSTAGKGGPMEFMKDPSFPALMQYASRVSFVMAVGRPTSEVALLLPAESLWMGDKSADDMFVSTERLLSEHQIDFDIVDEDAIGAVLKMEPGSFLSGSGNRYRTVLVPRADLLPEAVVERLHKFALSGGKVLFLGKYPSWIAGRSDHEARHAEVADFGWATVVSGELPMTPTPPAQPPAAPPEPLVVPPAILEAVLAAVPSPPLKLDTPAAGLRMTMRRLNDSSVFLLFNESPLPLRETIALNRSGKHVEIWDAQRGTTQAVSVVRPSPHRRLQLDLAPYATEILVIR